MPVQSQLAGPGRSGRYEHGAELHILAESLQAAFDAGRHISMPLSSQDDRRSVQGTGCGVSLDLSAAPVVDIRLMLRVTRLQKTRTLPEPCYDSE